MRRIVTLFTLCLGTAALAQNEPRYMVHFVNTPIEIALNEYAGMTGKRVEIVQGLSVCVTIESDVQLTRAGYLQLVEDKLKEANIGLFPISTNRLVATWIDPSLAPKIPTTFRGRIGAHSVTNDTASVETLRKQLEQYQMGVIRTGPPPLPIPLTKEMDDQLVKEGILPPLDGENAEPKTPNPEIQPAK